MTRPEASVSIRAHHRCILPACACPQVDSPSGGQLALKVNGVARVPAPQSLYGSVVNIMTVGGTVILDGDLITFEEVGWEAVVRCLVICAQSLSESMIA